MTTFVRLHSVTYIASQNSSMHFAALYGEHFLWHMVQMSPENPTDCLLRENPITHATPLGIVLAHNNGELGTDLLKNVLISWIRLLTRSLNTG